MTPGILGPVSNPPPIAATGLSVSFGPRKALDGLSLVAAAGQVTALLGPNGAGKTTFIRCCTGLVHADRGDVRLFGDSPGTRSAVSRVGLMPQQTGAWSQIAPQQLLRYLSRLYEYPQPTKDIMRLLGIDAFATTPYRRLSGGQQQLVNLAGALIGRPELVFLDEPTAGLDVRVKRFVWELIRQVRGSGVAVLLTTHDMREAAELADGVHIIDRGRITVSGTVEELTRVDDLETVFLSHTSPAEAGR
ncbi:MAG: ABC transporter ATP-binding protein [Arachnia sp.]